MADGFPQTRWSIVAAVRSGGDGTAAQKALNELCRAYWYPLYAFARGRGLPPEDAADRTQDFFASVLRADLFAQADPALGRLRTFLLTAFKHDLIDHHRRRCAARRGGGLELVPLHEAEQRLLAELTTPPLTPDEAWDRRWAIALLDEAMEQVRNDFVAGGKAALFESLRPLIDKAADNSAYDALCSLHGITRVAARQSVHRLRVRFRDSLRRCVADTLADPSAEQIREEFESLSVALARK